MLSNVGIPVLQKTPTNLLNFRRFDRQYAIDLDIEIESVQKSAIRHYRAVIG
uniref:Uncharacterized protein n=1 Tax=Romanomermis culicivorax TaxID=13658 RepID=A0A915HV11_ROMCU